MRNTLILVVVLLLLGGLSWYVVSTNASNTLSEDSHFAIEDTASIGQIFIAGKDGNVSDLKQKGKFWTLNDTLKASKFKVNMLLNTIRRIDVFMPVPENEKEIAVKNLATSSYKVEIMDTLGEEIKTYYIGGGTRSYSGNYAIMEGSNNPYIVHIKGFEGYLTPRYQIHPQDWRDPLLTAVKPNTLKKVKVSYPDTGRHGFTVVATEEGFDVLEHPNPDSVRVYDYLKTFGKFYAAGYIWRDKQIILDSLNNMTPFAYLEIEDENPEYSKQLAIYYNPASKAEIAIAVPKNSKDLIAISYPNLRKIFVNRIYFDPLEEERDWIYM